MPVLPIFKLMCEMGKVEKSEAYRVFNMGIGMVWFVPENTKDAAMDIIRKAGYACDVIGEVVPGTRKVEVL
jgi:phosphoribosylformylglycinamidine cyclo-ligase